MASARKSAKLTIVGDGLVGKTCMLMVYRGQDYPDGYIPTIFENCVENMIIDGEQFNVTLSDTAGQEDYERLRPLSYPKTDCFVLCYSISSRASYENIVLKWNPELKDFSQEIPVILVATKIDLRKVPEPIKGLVTLNEGKKLKNKIKASAFVECSALTGEGVKTVFEEALRAAVGKRNNDICCLIL